MDPLLPTHSSMFGDYQIGGTSRSQTHEVIPESPFTAALQCTHHGLSPFDQNYTYSPPVQELAAFSLQSLKCPQCKGRRFDFTAYFHNEKVFRSPPHELLYLVERSYILKNRLQSLLVTYIVNDVRGEFKMQDTRDDILDWVGEVANLTKEVNEAVVNVDGVEAGLKAVETWTEGIASRLSEHLEGSGGRKMEVPKGWKKEVLSEFRRQWEKVWIACPNACVQEDEMLVG